MRFSLLIAFCFLSFFSSHSFSAIYTFTCTISGCTPQSSASSAGQQFFSMFEPIAGYKYSFSTCSVRSYGADYNCYGSSAQIGSYTAIILRDGDTCPANSTLDSVKGECIPDLPPEGPCEPRAGQTAGWGLGRPDLNGMGPIENLCLEGCQLVPSSSTCGPSPLGDGTGQCSGLGTFSGLLCATGDTPAGGYQPPPPDPTDPTDPPPPPDCGPDATWSGSTCVPNQPPPDPEDPEDPDDPDNPNPGGGGGGDNGGGDDGGGGDGGNNGGGDGTGGGGDGGPGPGNTVIGLDCDKPLACTGDAIQCAILTQNKKQHCSWEYKDAKPIVDAELSKDEYQLGASDVDVSGIFTQATTAARWLPSNCPAPQNASLRSGVSISLTWQPQCDMATSLAPLIVALASIFFAVYVGRAFGGS